MKTPIDLVKLHDSEKDPTLPDFLPEQFTFFGKRVTFSSLLTFVIRGHEALTLLFVSL